MESSSFYITLPSNASMDYYSKNTACCYQIRLPRTFYLKGKYEVGLAEIQYPHTWETFTEEEDYRFNIRIGDQIIPIATSSGYYKDTEQLVTEINKRIREAFSDISAFENFCVTFKYHSLSRKTKFILKDGCSIIFNQGLADVLGFEAYHAYTESSESLYYSDIKRGFYTLYTYCSICEPQVVGDYYVPLLRAVNITGKDGDVIMKYYNEPHYVPVNTSKFDTIEINIKDDTGRNVSFKAGKVICKLHFRQKAL